MMVIATKIADEPTTAETPGIKEGPIHQLQSLRSDGRLTYRELEVLSHVADGFANKQIARTLYISEHTVKNHMTTIMRKLDAKDRTHAVVSALRQGCISL